MNTTALTNFPVGGPVSLNGCHGGDITIADPLSAAEALRVRTGLGNDTAALTNCSRGFA